MEAGSTCQIPWSWSNRWLWASKSAVNGSQVLWNPLGHLLSTSTTVTNSSLYLQSDPIRKTNCKMSTIRQLFATNYSWHFSVFLSYPSSPCPFFFLTGFIFFSWSLVSIKLSLLALLPGCLAGLPRTFSNRGYTLPLDEHTVAVLWLRFLITPNPTMLRVLWMPAMLLP